MSRNAGFTLVELMVTLSVAGICACVALPSMGAMLERQRTNAAIGSLLTHMSLARMAAISYRVPAVLCPTATGNGCDAGLDWSGGWMMFLDRDGDRRLEAGELPLRVDRDPTSRHLLVSSTVGRTSLRYLPDGRAAGTNLTISVCNRHEQLLGQVVVNNTGRPRSERPAAPTRCPG